MKRSIDNAPRRVEAGCVQARVRFTLLIVQFAKFVILYVLCAACATLPGRTAELQAAASEPARLSYAQLIAAGTDALGRGHADAAAALAADACRMDSQRAAAYLLWGRALAHTDHLAQSSAKLERARSLGCRDLELFAELASNYDVEQRYEAALSVYQDYLTDHPHDATMRDELALTYLLLKRPKEAIAALRQALKDRPDARQLRQDLGYALLMDAAYGEAAAVLQAVVHDDPSIPEARRLWAQALAGQRQLDAALAVLDELLVAFPRDRPGQALRQAVAKLQAAQKATAEAATSSPPNDSFGLSNSSDAPGPSDAPNSPNLPHCSGSPESSGSPGSTDSPASSN